MHSHEYPITGEEYLTSTKYRDCRKRMYISKLKIFPDNILDFGTGVEIVELDVKYFKETTKVLNDKSLALAEK